jgi:hypothetical protein
MEETKVTHITINGQYKVQYEQGATKGVLGFKVEANGDDLAKTEHDAQVLLGEAKKQAAAFYPPVEVK